MRISITIRYVDVADEPRWPGGFHRRAMDLLSPLLPLERPRVGPFLADKIADWPEIRVIPYFDAVLKFGPKVRFQNEQILLEGIVNPNCVATFLRWGVEIVRSRQERTRQIGSMP